MNKNLYKLIPKIINDYKKGINIIRKYKKIDKDFSIQVSYDIQTGTYNSQHKKYPNLRKRTSDTISQIINSLGNFKNILEVGAGECTNFIEILKKINNKKYNAYAFDISLSRISLGRKLCKKRNTYLFQSDLFNLPFKDNSIDILYTLHSLEPNGGREVEALKELYRVTRKFLILYEPIYEFGNSKVKRHIKKNDYVRNLYKYCKELDFKIIEYKFLYNSLHSSNNTGLIIIQKKIKKGSDNNVDFVCPITNCKLTKDGNILTSKGKSGLIYPIINGIPSLVKSNAILSTKL